MPIKVSVYIATSLDGFIARPKGDLDWLPQGSSDNEDYGYSDFIDSIDTLVMGRKSFEKVLTFGGWPYDDKHVVVLSHGNPTVPDEIKKTVEVSNLPPVALVDYLAQAGYKHLYIDGGVTVQSFLAAGLIQEMIITTIPILIGQGLPLFGPLEQDIKLRHLHTQSYDSGFVQTKYQVII